MNDSAGCESRPSMLEGSIARRGPRASELSFRSAAARRICWVAAEADSSPDPLFSGVLPGAKTRQRLFQVLHEKQIREVSGVTKNVVLFVRRDSRAGDAYYASYVSRRDRFPYCSGSG